MKRNNVRHSNSAHIPPLRTIQLSTRKMRRNRRLPLYRLEKLCLDGEKLYLSLDWVSLSSACVRVEVKGAGQISTAFPLKSKVIYGRKTEFSAIDLCLDVSRVFPLARSCEPVTLVLWLEGTLPLQPATFVLRHIARLPLPALRHHRHLRAMDFLPVLSVLAATTIMLSTLCH